MVKTVLATFRRHATRYVSRRRRQTICQPIEGDIATLPSPSAMHTTVFSCDVSLTPKLNMRFGNACNEGKVATVLIYLWCHRPTKQTKPPSSSHVYHVQEVNNGLPFQSEFKADKVLELWEDHCLRKTNGRFLLQNSSPARVSILEGQVVVLEFLIYYLFLSIFLPALRRDPLTFVKYHPDSPLKLK